MRRPVPFSCLSVKSYLFNWHKNQYVKMMLWFNRRCLQTHFLHLLKTKATSIWESLMLNIDLFLLFLLIVHIYVCEWYVSSSSVDTVAALKCHISTNLTEMWICTTIKSYIFLRNCWYHCFNLIWTEESPYCKRFTNVELPHVSMHLCLSMFIYIRLWGADTIWT